MGQLYFVSTFIIMWFIDKLNERISNFEIFNKKSFMTGKIVKPPLVLHQHSTFSENSCIKVKHLSNFKLFIVPCSILYLWSKASLIQNM